MKKKTGTVYLVGAGPGDPGLITDRGKKLLASSDAVVYDGLVNKELLDFCAQAEQVDVSKKHFKGPTSSRTRNVRRVREQEKIHKLLAGYARKGKNVVRLKGGDPFIFGRGGEELSFLQTKKIPFEVVPGVSAGHGVPAYAGIPVTDRRFASSVTYVTCHEDPAKGNSSIDWASLAGLKGTIVFFMGVKNLPSVIDMLIRNGRSPLSKVSVIERGSMPSQRIVEGSLKTIVQKVRKEKIESPAITVLGEVNSIRKFAKWFEKKPLYGKTVLVTRAQAQASTLKEKLQDKGCQVLQFPSIRILPPASWKGLDGAIKKINTFDWVVFTSTNGVQSFFERLYHLRKDTRDLAGVKIAAIGEATKKALREQGVQADLTPKYYHSEGLIQALKKKKQIRGKHFLLPRTNIAPPYLREALKGGGGKVTQVVAYRTASTPGEKKKLTQWMKNSLVDYVLFTSSSTVKNFFDAAPKKISAKTKPKFVSIGPVTTKTLRSFGHKPFREARVHTIEGLIQALIKNR